MADILIIDDDRLFAETVADKLEDLDHTPTCAHSLQAGVDEAAKYPYDIVFLDVYLPDGNGLDAIDTFREVPSEPEIIIITGQGDPDGAELAIRHGAWCYLEKQSFIKEVTLPLTRALQYRQALKVQKQTLQGVEREQLVGESPPFLKCLDLLAKAGVSEANVLVSGDSGTGKEAFARAIHTNSRRRSANFVVVDCAALPEQLVESVLFGHVKGAFTGADKTNRGLIRHANKGTLFLDEVGELPLATQKSFLRVLQERRFCPVGSHEECCSNFRLVSATNRNLTAMTEQGLFREDLFHRLQVMHIPLPPLKDRKGDVALLTDHFLENLCRRYGQHKKEYLPDFIEHLTAYSWPGNVRELSHAIESSFAEAVHSPTLFTQHLPIHIRAAFARSTVKGGDGSSGGNGIAESEALLPWKSAKEEFERVYIRRILRQTSGNIAEAGRLSGLSRTRLYQLIKKYETAEEIVL